MTPTPASTDQKIWAIAWPMMLSSMSVPMLGLVDTALLGHLEGARFLGAVAIGANFIGLMYWSFGFLRMGTTSLTAQQRGADSSAAASFSSAPSSTNIDAILFRALAMALGLGALVALAVPLLIDQILAWMQASAEVAPLAAEYIDIRRYSAPAVFMTFAVHGYLVGIQKPRGALVLVLVTNIANIVLDVWFIVYLGWESAGAAWATLIAEWLGLAIGLLMVMHYSGAMRVGQWRAWFSLAAFAHMLGFNYHLLIRTMLLLFVFNFFTAQGSAMGDDVLAANAILLQLVLFSAFVLDGFSFAAEALGGEAYGAKRWQILDTTVRACAKWSLLAALAFALVYSALGAPLVRLFSDVEPVLLAALRDRWWIVPITLLGATAYLMDGVCIGAGKTRAMHYSMWFSTAVVFLPAWWLARPLGNDGLWLAYFLFVIARGATLLLYWLRVRAQLLAGGAQIH
ncbi:MAG: MATE family efflux transporter [Pseudomonadales bacterium]|nr:MATE family efflux transporter [Pseudomonadales bacterium]NNL10187.1 MATE family efflux transporter [Pseudomonadales bacterium]